MSHLARLIIIGKAPGNGQDHRPAKALIKLSNYTDISKTTKLTFISLINSPLGVEHGLALDHMEFLLIATDYFCGETHSVSGYRYRERGVKIKHRRALQ